MSFSDIPIRINGKDHLIDASWWNTIRTELILAFGSGGYIFEESAQTILGAGEIVYTSTAFKNLIPMEGNGGAVTISDTPFGTAHGFTGGKEVILMGTSDTNTITINTTDVPSGIISNGKIVLTRFSQVILIYNAALDRFIRQE